MASNIYHTNKIAPNADGVFARLCVVPDPLDIT